MVNETSNYKWKKKKIINCEKINGKKRIYILGMNAKVNE